MIAELPIAAAWFITAIAAASRLSITERLAEAGIEPSVGSAADNYDHALAETMNGFSGPN